MVGRILGSSTRVCTITCRKSDDVLAGKGLYRAALIFSFSVLKSRLRSTNGVVPVASSYRMQPSDHTSDEYE